MEWISVLKQLPKKEGYYACMCLYSAKPLKCKFRKGKNGPREWRPYMFIHEGRVPFVVYWKRKNGVD